MVDEKTTKTVKSTKAQSNGHATVEESNALSNNDTSNNYLFLVYELSKRYGNFLAVEEISFGVKQHECFGLLGVNGAGKSTTFKMMTGESIPNNGVMYLGNKNCTRNRKNVSFCSDLVIILYIFLYLENYQCNKNSLLFQYLSQMGYCPQNDAIIRCLNATDHLRLFARLRGIPEPQVNSEVKKWIDRLSQYKNNYL